MLYYQLLSFSISMHWRETLVNKQLEQHFAIDSRYP